MMKKLITNDLGANNTVAEGWTSFKNILGITADKRAEVEKWFNQDYLQNDNKVYLTDNGRTGLYMLLKSLELPADSEVILQAFTCVVVPNAILQAGLKPKFIDIAKYDDSDLTKSLNIDFDAVEQYCKQKSNKAKVLIIQHTMGHPADITQAKEICEKYDLVLVEDCAHSLEASYEYEGKLHKTGTLGDAAIFSFSRDKVVSSTTGGAVVINKDDEKWRERLGQMYEELPNMSAKRVFKCLFYIWCSTVLIRPWYYRFGIGKAIHKVVDNKLKMFDEVYAKKEARGSSQLFVGAKFSSKLSEVLMNQLNHLNQTQKHRHQLAQKYSELLGTSYGENNNYMRYNVVVEPEQYDRIANDLWSEARAIVGKWYNSVVLPATCDLDTVGLDVDEVPNAVWLSSNRVLNLPTSIIVDESDVERIAKVVKGV